MADPYGLHHRARKPGSGIVALVAPGKNRLAKAHQVNLLKPKGVILGSSRAGVLRADHPGWSTTPVYNLALPASVIYEQLRYFQHAHAAQPLQQAVIGLDLLAFNGFQGPFPGFAEERLNVDRHNRPLPRSYTDLVASLLSIDALKDSYNVLIAKRSRRSDKDVSVRKRFRATERMFSAGGAVWFPAPRFAFSLREHGTDELTIIHFREMVALAYHDNIDLRMFISPPHARLLEAMRGVDLWPTFERWKRLLVEANEQEAILAGKMPFPLLDFSGYNAYTTEPLPRQKDPDQTMRWYKESSHYSPELGAVILDRLFSASDEAGGADSFGVRLTRKTIDSHLARIRRERERYAATHPDEVQEVREITEGMRTTRRGVID